MEEDLHAKKVDMQLVLEMQFVWIAHQVELHPLLVCRFVPLVCKVSFLVFQEVHFVMIALLDLQRI
jgi:hypothetical protein